MNKNVEEYTRSFTSFSGADIVATFHGRVIGELQGITYSVAREVAPVYTMGSPDPRSFSRGKRGISGSLIFTQFDRDALLEEMRKDYDGAPAVQKFQQYVANMVQSDSDILNGLRATGRGYGIENWDEMMTRLGYGQVGGQASFDFDAITGFYTPEYADQLMPFNIAISMANEYGQRAGMEIYGVQLLDEGSGFSVDDVVAAKAYTFVARKIKPVEKKDNLRSQGRDSAVVSSGEFFNSRYV